MLPGNAPQIVQSKFVEIALDTSTSSTTFVPLLSITLVTDSDECMCHFSVSGDNSADNHNVVFQLLVDGVAACGSKFRNMTTGGSTSLVYCTDYLSPDTHTFAVRWLTDGGMARILPVTNIQDHASLLVEEITR